MRDCLVTCKKVYSYHYLLVTLLTGLLLLVMTIANAYGNGYKAKKPPIYKFKSVDGVTSFSGIEPIGLDYQQVRIDCYACRLDSLINWRTAKLYLTEFSQAINQAALVNNIDPAFVRAIIHAESHFNPQALSKQGAQGLMQLMPATAKWLGVKDAFVARQNINAGVRHLARLLNKYHGDTTLTAAAYNAGEGTIKRFGGIPPYAETKVYIERVGILHQRYQGELARGSI